MDGMTIRQIARLTGKSHQTIGRWIEVAKSKMDSIKSKMDKASSRYPVRFTLDEIVAIVKAGGNHTLADLLMENAKRTARQIRVERLPNGKQLEELRRIYGEQGAARRIDFVLGYSRHEEIATPEEADRHFRLIKERFGQRTLPGMS